MSPSRFGKVVLAALLFIGLIVRLRSPAVGESCVGDCDGNGEVTIEELTTMVNIALGNAPLSDCEAGDANGDAEITIDEIVTAVNFALGECPPAPTATPTATPVLTPPTPTPTSSPPVITDFTPKSGPVGTLVTITGKNFAVLPGQAPQVTMNKQGGGTIAAPIASFDDGSIKITVPTSADSGVLTVTVGGQSISSSVPFTVQTTSSFSIAALPRSAQVIRGYSTAFSLQLSSTNGFAQLATLSVSGLSAGMDASFKPALIGAGQQSVLTVTAASDQVLQTVNFEVSASARVDGLDTSSSVPLTLAVREVTTSFMGRTVVDDTLQTSLGGVTITFLGRDGDGNLTGCTGQTVADAAGNFAFTDLPPECTGKQLIRYDGLSATNPPGRYAGVDLVYDIASGQVTESPVLVHLPRIDDKETVLVKQSAPQDQIFCFKTIPGLCATVYAGTTFVLVDGTQPDPFPFTAVQVPVDRLPDKKPFNPAMMMVFIVAFQPANTTASQPVAITYPNSVNTTPGTNMVLMTLDPTKGRMVQYGTGTVSQDGTQVIPDLDPAHPGHRFGLVHFDWHGQMPPPPPVDNPLNPGPPDNGTCPLPRGGKPIDIASGLEILREPDIAISGLRGGISIERVYRSFSREAGPFGIGTGHNYGYRLDTSAPQNAGVVNLIAPDGSRFPFVQIPGSALGPLKAVLAIPALRGVELSTMPDGRSQVRFKDGTVFSFIPSGPVSLLDAITDANGNRVSLVRDSTRPVRITQIVDPIGRRLVLAYDGSDRITTITDPIGRMVTYAYNAQGTLKSLTDPAQKVTQYEYDVQNRLTKVIDARGITAAQIEYDATTGRAIKETLAGGGEWRFDYTLFNPLAPTSPVRETTVTDPLGNVTGYRFNPQGFLLDVTDALGQTRVFEREAGTNLLPAIKGSASCGACGGVGPGDRFFTYDDDGNLTSATDALGNTTSFTYEPAFNKVESVTDALHNQTMLAYGAGGTLRSVTDANQHTTAFTYDTFGQLAVITDPLGHQTQISYDAFGNPVAITDALGSTTRRVYDGVSRLTEVTDALGRTTRITYDPLSRIVGVVNAHRDTIQMTRDAVGKLISFADARGNVTSFTYDPIRRENTRTDSLGKTDYRRYDVAGNLVEFVDRRGLSNQFTYDALSRLIRETYVDAVVQRTYDQFGQLSHVTDTRGGDFSFTYDLAGGQLSAAGPFGAITYVRDELGRINQRQVVGQSPVTYEYDGVGNLTLAAMLEASVAFAYDERNQLVTEERSNGVTSKYEYDPVRRLLKLTHFRGPVPFDTQIYTYDVVGNRISKTLDIGQPLITQPNRFINDAHSDELLQRGSLAYSYDENGNRLTENGAAGETRYGWDARNRLVSIVSPGSITDLQYDFDANLISETTRVLTDGRANARTFVLDDLTNVAAITTSSAEHLSVLTGRSIDQHLAITGESGITRFRIPDAINSTVATIDSNGAIESQFLYEPFGQTTAIGSPNLFQFTGRVNVSSDLYYYRSRYYDSISGRFVSEDPIGIGGTSNLYQYVRNSPVNLVDPSGLLTPGEVECKALCKAFCAAVSLECGGLPGLACGPLCDRAACGQDPLQCFKIAVRQGRCTITYSQCPGNNGVSVDKICDGV